MQASFLILIVHLTTLVVAQAALNPRQSGWPACQDTLSCSFWDIESASMQARLEYMQYMQASHFGELNATDRLLAIEGVILFFLSESLGEPGSWVSHVDAGIIEGIQSGAALALSLPVAVSAPPADNNPGITVWASYYDVQRSPDGFLTRQAHDSAWGEAEATSTEWAKVEVADAVAQPPATRRELNWYEFTKLFRWILRNEDSTILLLRPFVFPERNTVQVALTRSSIFLTHADDFVFWLTDTTRVEPALCGSQAAWAVAGTLTFDLENVVQFPANVLSLLRAIYDCGSDLIEGV
jgi:hypothetical protein